MRLKESTVLRCDPCPFSILTDNGLSSSQTPKTKVAKPLEHLSALYITESKPRCYCLMLASQPVLSVALLVKPQTFVNSCLALFFPKDTR